MKNILNVILIILLAGFGLINERLTHKDEAVNNSYQSDSSTHIFKPISRTPVSYNFQIEYLQSKRMLNVKQSILWINLSEFPTSEIYLSLPANAYMNNKTLYFTQEQFDEKMKSGYKFNSINCDSEEVKLNYYTDKIFLGDSTIAKIETGRTIGYGDSVKITLEYKIEIPQGASNFGYSKGGRFCLLADWHPFITRYEMGVWDRSSWSNLTQPGHEYSSITAKLKLPDFVTASSSANEIGLENNNSINTISYSQPKGSHLTLAFYEEVLIKVFEVPISSNNSITVDLYVLTENERYIERIIIVVERSIEFLNENVDEFPFSKLSIINIPNKANFIADSYESIISFKSDLISPKLLQNPEYDIAKMICSQYFKNSLSVSRQEDRWIEYGIPTYLATKIISKYYGNTVMYFHLAGYVPVYGLNLLSYNEIPIIYTLKEFEYSPALKGIGEYYKYIHSNPVSTSFNNLSRNYNYANYSVKPSLILNSLENEVGDSILINSIECLYRNTTDNKLTESLIRSISINNDSSITQFLKDGFTKPIYYDYKLESLLQLGDSLYQANLLRIGTGICPADILIHSKTDTLIFEWDGKAKKHQINFKSGNKIYAAEIKPKFAELLDVNIANNTYTVDPEYWGSISIAVRAFFWFQNALMIFGSIG